MPNYDLDRLGDKEFEHLVQSLLKKVIGQGTITFGEGPDGGREATFSGESPYPSREQQWKGEWIFQAKYHNTRLIGLDKARKEVLNDLKSELEKITVKYKRKCDNYILATNVPFSSVPELGTHDKILKQILPNYSKSIPNIHVWGYDDLARFLDGNPDVRQTYLHLITPGDLIAELMDRQKFRKSKLAEAVLLYVRTSFEREQYAQLDQAGEIGEKPLPLRRVFIDLNVKPRSEKDIIAVAEASQDMRIRLRQFASKEAFSATDTLVVDDIPRTVLIGGPGQGKSTLGQFVSQIHRAYILQKTHELNGGKKNYTPSIVRIPFRIILRDYAQWIVDAEAPHTVERFLAALVEERAGRQVTTEQFQEIIKDNPTLFIFDGLDEVTDRRLRSQMLALLTEFIARCEDVLKANLQVIATSRPTGYSDQFDPSHFLHLFLISMSNEKAMEYTEKWITAKGLETAKASFLRSSIKDCLADQHFSPLMNTPLQVTIFILIILNGGTPPRQREELFNEYLEVIYKRERSKSKTIIQTEKRLLFGLHQYLGYILHSRAAESSDTRSRMKEEEFAKEVFNYLRHEDPYSDPNELRQRADQMINEARKRLVLLVEFDDAYFGFDLRSIQEFFAAGWLTDRASGDKQRFERFQAIALPSHWRNVALFFAGRIGRSFPGEAALILEACREIDRHRPDNFLRRGAWLALEIAIDRSFGPNRILQRSGLEYGLTLLDGDLDRERRIEFVSRLRRLPAEDLQQHVIPLLSERLLRINLPNEFTTLDVFQALTNNKSQLEEIITTARDQRSVKPEILLGKALEYNLSPEYIKSAFLDIFPTLSENDLVKAFRQYFFANPTYIADILRSTDIPENVGIVMFYSALESGVIEPPLSRPRIEFSVPSEKIDQLSLAWEIARTLKYSSREYHYRYEGLFETIDWRYRDQLRFFSENIDDQKVLNKSLLAEMVLTESALIELRATALAFLSKYFFPNSNHVVKIIELFQNSISKDEAEVTEDILFKLRAPSLEMKDSLSEVSRYVERERHQSFELYERFARYTDIAKGEGLSALFTIDAFSESQIKGLMGFGWNPGGEFKKFPIQFLHLMVRLGSSVGHLPGRRHTASLSVSFVAKVLSVASEILHRNGSDKWRAWSAISRLSLFEWEQSSRRLLRKKKDLEKALDAFCNVLEHSITPVHEQWKVKDLIARAIELDGLHEHIIRMLRIMSKIPDNWLTDSTVYSSTMGNMNPNIVVRLFSVSKDADDVAFLGFLKWFSLWAANIRLRFPAPEIEIPHLAINIAQMNSILEKGHGVIREAAILLLGHSGVISLDEANRLLEFSKHDNKPIDRAWADLVKATVRDSPEDIEFLERILSAGSKYPKAVKYAALEKYQRIAKPVAINERECDLGLPFQDEQQ